MWETKSWTLFFATGYIFKFKKQEKHRRRAERWSKLYNLTCSLARVYPQCNRTGASGGELRLLTMVNPVSHWHPWGMLERTCQLVGHIWSKMLYITWAEVTTCVQRTHINTVSEDSWLLIIYLKRHPNVICWRPAQICVVPDVLICI